MNIVMGLNLCRNLNGDNSLDSLHLFDTARAPTAPAAQTAGSELAASCAAAYVSYLLTREEMSTNARLATHTAVQYVAQIAVQLISCASASSAVAHDTTAYSSSLSENVGAVHTLKTAFTRNTASFVRGRNEIVR